VDVTGEKENWYMTTSAEKKGGGKKSERPQKIQEPIRRGKGGNVPA